MDLDALFRQTDTVSMRKFVPHQNLDFTSVCVEDELLREESLRGLLPMCCHRLEHGRWSTRRFLLDSNLIRIGRRLGKADIVVDGPYVEDVQVTLQIFGGRWFIIESGIYNLLSVNGIRRRQASVTPWSACLIQIGETPIALSIPPKSGYSPSGERILTGAPESGDNGYYLIDSSGKKSFYDTARSALVGAGEACDFRIDAEEFAAVISSFEGELYLCPLFNPEQFKVDGRPAKRLQPLHHGARIEIGASSFSVETSSMLGPSAGSEFEIPNMLDVEICLLEVDESRNCGEVFRLPPAGELFGIGRGEENYLCIASQNISRDHAKAKVNSTNLVLQDSYSRNGTFVNDEKIQKKTVKPGDIIRFGDKSFLLSFAPIRESQDA